MTRNDVVDLLRYRWRTCNQRFDDETVDAWHETLDDIDQVTCRRVVRELIRGGAKTLALGEIAQRCTPPRRPVSTESLDELPERLDAVNATGLAAVREVLRTFSAVGVKLHDPEAHDRDRRSGATIPTCPRCRDHHDTFHRLWRLR